MAIGGCSHCGEPCPDLTYVNGDQRFCCIGCQTVYGLLHENGLGDYYTLENTPGTALIAHAAAGGVDSFTLSETLFHHPAGEVVIQGWSDALANGRALPEAVRTAA